MTRAATILIQMALVLLQQSVMFARPHQRETSHGGKAARPTIWASVSTPTQHAEVEKCHTQPLLQGTWKESGAPHAALQLHGTSFVQQDIWRHQHPAHCSNASFLVFQKTYGIGAALDQVGGALGLALDLNRVLILDFEDRWTKAPTSGKNGYCKGLQTLDTCYFEPLSSCSLQDIYGAEFVTAYNENPDGAALAERRRQVHSDRILFMALQGINYENKLPDRYKSLMSYPGVQSHVHVGGVKRDVYWYRAQAIAYIVRPNKRTLAELERRKAIQFPGQFVRPGTLSVHVRHGDKGGEMQLMPDEEYIKAAESMLDGNDALQRNIFLSTEDPATVEYFRGLSEWSVQHTLTKRTAHDGLAPFQVPDPTDEFLNSLLNLDLAASCDAYVCTLSSLWCTLIDRLRSTSRCKADAPYIDVHGSLGGLGHVNS